MKRSDIKTMTQYFEKYINQVDDVELSQAFDDSIKQLDELDKNLLATLDGKRYAPDKWTTKEIFQHLIDWERILSFRALLFARKEGSIPQSVDGDLLAANMNADRRSIDGLIDELKITRLSTKALFESFDDDTLQNTGTNWKYEISVLAMGLTIIGHQIHHLKIIEEKYYPLSGKTQEAPEASFYSPRPYLSWSQIQLFERSPDLYAQKYLSGKDEEQTEAMRLGKRLSEALEIQEKTGDDALDNLISFFPNYPEREYEIESKMDGVEVPLYGVLDGFDPESLRIGENKSGRLWTQEMVDESGQLKMYALLVWLKYQKMPSEILLHWARTQYNEGGELEFAGEIASFEAKIALKDVIIFSERVREAWMGIKKLCEQHYRSIN